MAMPVIYISKDVFKKLQEKAAEFNTPFASVDYILRRVLGLDTSMYIAPYFKRTKRNHLNVER